MGRVLRRAPVQWREGEMNREWAVEPCGECGDRRRFLREMAAVAAGTLVAMGASRRQAVALGLGWVRAVGRYGDLAIYDLPAADGVSIDRENQIIIARYQGAVYAFDLSCPHQRSMLKWLGGEGRFQCGKHKSKYQPDGMFISGRATRHMDRHPIKRENGKLVVELDVVFRSDKEPAEWERAAVKV
jgi:nitrite reductase/ring-hydroxylating ferredoxin subunit